MTYARNFTDVDDKIIKRATENGETCDALVTRYALELSQLPCLHILVPEGSITSALTVQTDYGDC